MGWFFRRSNVGREPLVITMSGVRSGERVLQINIDNPRIAGDLAAKAGINGEAAVVVADEQRAATARRAAAEAGALVDVQVAPFNALPFANAAFDVVVIHSGDGLIDSLGHDVRAGAVREWRRVLRSGGRLLAVEPGTRSGLGTMFRPAPRRDPQYEAGGGTLAALEAAGFKPVRLLADRDGSRFIEGMR